VRPIPRVARTRTVGWQVGATPLRLSVEEATQDLAMMEVSIFVLGLCGFLVDVAPRTGDR
jgi:hypothetical protein